MTHRRAPRKAGEAFRVARDLAAPKTGLASVQAAWAGAVGEGIAEVAQPVSERAGTLTVECSNAMWAQELDLMQAQLLERLGEALGDGAPQALKFRVARGL
jgi:predicted nucleic acid-binding Zn ribbon protein